MEPVSRRTFLAACLGLITAGSSAAVAWALYHYLAPLPGSSAVASVTIPEKELAPGTARFVQYGGSPAVVVNTGNAVVALSAVCTHLGCIVQWEKEKQQFLCPCHGGEFSADGKVLAGPPPAPLKRLPVAIANGIIAVG